MTTALTLAMGSVNAPAQFPGTNGRFVFRDGNDLSTLSKTGGDLQTLTTVGGATEYPSYSPDGKTVVFDADINGDGEIFRVSSKGGKAKRLTNNKRYDWGASMGPDGRIVFVCERPSDSEICVMNGDGSKPQTLTKNDDNEWNPKWSPDGSKIVFSSDRVDGNQDIFVMRANGKRQRFLAGGPNDDYEPDFSPNGKRIAYVDAQYSPARLVVMDANGSNALPINTGAPDVRTPTWAPDGSVIGFCGSSNIYTIAPNGTGFDQLTTGEASDNCGWQPK